jgi:hypothetical protein
MVQERRRKNRKDSMESTNIFLKGKKILVKTVCKFIAEGKV